MFEMSTTFLVSLKISEKIRHALLSVEKDRTSRKKMGKMMINDRGMVPRSPCWVRAGTLDWWTASSAEANGVQVPVPWHDNPKGCDSICHDSKFWDQTDLLRPNKGKQKMLLSRRRVDFSMILFIFPYLPHLPDPTRWGSRFYQSFYEIFLSCSPRQ